MGIPKELKPLAQEARKYKSVEEFVEEYGPITREVSKGKPILGALGEYTPEGKIKVKSTLKAGEIKDVLGHERRHAVTGKIEKYLLKISDSKYKEIEKKISKMPIVSGVETEEELESKILEQFTYNNQQLKKDLPEIYSILDDYFNLRKQARSIPNLTDFYTQATQRSKRK